MSLHELNHSHKDKENKDKSAHNVRTPNGNNKQLQELRNELQKEREQHHLLKQEFQKLIVDDNMPQHTMLASNLNQFKEFKDQNAHNTSQINKSPADNKSSGNRLNNEFRDLSMIEKNSFFTQNSEDNIDLRKIISATRSTSTNRVPNHMRHTKSFEQFEMNTKSSESDKFNANHDNQLNYTINEDPNE